MGAKKKPTNPIDMAMAALFPKEEEGKSKPRATNLRIAPMPEETDKTAPASESSMPELSAKAEDAGKSVKQFASASSASVHLQVVKAKRYGLTAMHKVVSLLVPKKKDDE